MHGAVYQLQMYSCGLPLALTYLYIFKRYAENYGMNIDELRRRCDVGDSPIGKTL